MILKCVEFSCTTSMRSILDLIVVMSYELGLKRPLSAPSYGLLKGLSNQVLYIHLVHNSALFLASCCSSLLHVVTSLSCMFVVSRQLVLLATFPKILHSFCGQKECTRLFFWEKNRLDVNCFFFILFRVQMSLPYNRVEDPVHYILLFLKTSGPKLV